MANFINPYAYQPPYQQTYQQQVYQQNSDAEIVYVRGDDMVRNYLVAPGHSKTFFDAEAQTYYLKSADASGIPSIVRFPRENAPEKSPTNDFSVDLSNYVTKDELRAEIKKIAKKEVSKDE